MRVLDLFSGIGGFSLGLERAGMTTVGFCEIDPFCREVLRKHWPEVWIHDDVRTLTTPLIRERCGHIDLIAGGFPCQDLSAAGKGAGLDGERSGLWWELCGIIARLRPRWLLIENVPALRTRGADRVLSCLEGIGYSVWPLVVGAWAVGAPHKRDRVWIVGQLADSNGNSVRKQSGRRSGKNRAGATVFGESGEELANANQCGRGGDEPQRQAKERAAARRAGETVADTECSQRINGHGINVQRRWPTGAEQAGLGSGAAMADSALGGLPTRPGLRIDGESPRRREPAGSDQQLADTPSRGQRADGSALGDAGHADKREPAMGNSECPRLEGQRPDAGQPQVSESRDAGAHRWPARPGEPQHEWEEPRLLELPLGGTVAGIPVRLVRRRNKLALKAYGNTVVPQVVEAIGRAILEVTK